MCCFGLKMNQVRFTMVIFSLLCCSIRPYLCYPHAEELKIEADENLSNGDNQDPVYDEDLLEEEQAEDLLEAIDVENAEATCIDIEKFCGPKDNPKELQCCKEGDDWVECKTWWNGEQRCSRMSMEQQKAQQKKPRRSVEGQV